MENGWLTLERHQEEMQKAFPRYVGMTGPWLTINREISTFVDFALVIARMLSLKA